MAVGLQLLKCQTSRPQSDMPCLPSVCIPAASSSNFHTLANGGARPPVCFMGGPIVNKLGVKWALVIGSMSFPIQGSAYYCNSKFGNQWVSCEACSTCLRATIELSLPSMQGLTKSRNSAVPYSQRCYQRYWHRVLVRR